MPKIAAIQMCSSESIDDNLKKAEKLITEAAQNAAELVVLPEMFAIISSDVKRKAQIKEKYGLGKIQNFLADQARKNKIWIVGGTIPLVSANENKISAACLIYDDQGKIAARYDKIHLFDVTISEQESYQESATTEPGNKLIVVDTPVGKLGLAVCYDLRFPALFTQLLNMGAEIIAVPAAFTMKTGEAHWELLTRSRAVENFCYVVGACQGGKHSNGRQTYGHSLIIEPWGSIIQQASHENEEIIYADIDLMRLHKIRNLMPVQKNQRFEIRFGEGGFPSAGGG